MSSRIVRLSFALILVAGSFLGLSADGQASEPKAFIFPWIPNGVVIDDPRGFDSLGPFYGSISVHNLNNEPVKIRTTATAGGLNLPGDFDLQPLESRTVSAADLQIPEGTGSGLYIWGEHQPTEEPRAISVVMKQSSPEAQSAQSETSNSHNVVGGYSGLPLSETGDTVVLPIAQTNNNWNTLIRVTHFAGGFPNELTIDLTLHPAGGGAVLGPFPVTIGSRETATFDLLELGIPEEWVGSAVLSSSVHIAAVAERVKNETGMLIMNSSTTVPGPGMQQYAPLIFRDWNHWNTGISIANLAATDNDVTVRYYGMDGDEVHSDDLTIPANGMDFLYLPAGAGDEEFVGSAFIEATESFVAAVDEVKYLGEDGDTGHAMSYMVDEIFAAPGDRLSMPLYQKGDPNSGGGDTSGVQLFNLGDTPVVFLVEIFDQSGNPAPAAPVELQSLEPKESRTLYAMANVDLPTGFTGSMVVSVESQGVLTGVSNNVNYDVQLDGSASFNMMIARHPDENGGPPGDFVTP